MFSYRSLLKQAWTVAWHHKYLWFLGLFASLTAAGGSWEYQLLTQNLNRNTVDGSYASMGGILAVTDLAKNFYLGLIDLFRYDFWTVLNALTLLLVAAILLVSFIWLAIVCQAALVKDIKKINTAKKDLTLTLRDSLTAGTQHFWSVLSLNLSIKVLVSLVFVLMSLPLVFMVISDTTTLAVIYMILFIIFIPVAMSISLLFKYAIAYSVLDNKSYVAAVEKGSQLFGKNWLVSLEMAIILFIINFLASGLVLAVMALFLLPLLLLGLMFTIDWLVIFTISLALIVTVIFGSFLTTFQTAAWTNLFLRLKEKGGLAKLERIFHRAS